MFFEATHLAQGYRGMVDVTFFFHLELTVAMETSEGQEEVKTSENSV